jgi:beta-lactam-binding protein with PASTA domain/tRNA A-37 threonylcarbamoyl transferase component Bud32
MSDARATVFNDRYELHRKLARGGMSDVYLARDLLLDRPVAVKVLFPEYARDPTFVERFRREARAAANLNHPNIVAIYDWGEQSGTYFIVMEYVEGRSLSDIIRADGPLHPRRSAEITADVAAALGFAHRNGVVHRDVKPGNVIISPSGQVKVADFGIAQAISGGADQSNLTQAGAVMGTATYFSPEQAQGKPVDPRSDLYSLGCVLFEMLTTRPPFGGDTPVAIAYQHVQSPAPLPSASGVMVPSALEAITMQLLAKDPGDRYASAEDLRADLRNYLEDLPVAALSSKAAIAAGVVAGALTVGSVAAATTQAVAPVGAPIAASSPQPSAAPYVPPQPAPKGRSSAFLWVLLGLLVVLAVGLFVIGTQLSKSNGQQITVETVTQKSVAEATAILQRQGFVVDARREANSDQPVDIVFDQSPRGGEKADKGSTIVLKVSAGLAQVEVPSVVGLTKAAAVSLLDNANLQSDVSPQNDPKIPVDQVISQSPAAKQMVEKGSKVTIVVSTGPATLVVPDVVGQSAGTASATLTAAGFKVTEVDEASSTVAAGKVISTNPDAGIGVAPGSKVTIVVSTGPAPTTSTTSTSTTKAPKPSTTSSTA